MTPEHVAVLRQLPPGMRVEQAFGLWRMARDAMYRQDLAKGLAPDEAIPPSGPPAQISSSPWPPAAKASLRPPSTGL